MSKTIQIRLSDSSIKAAIKDLEATKRKLENLQTELVKRLLEIGAESVRTTLSGHTYTGETIGTVDVEIATRGGEVRGVLSVGGQAILFLEFGAGLIGYGHPRAGEFGYGPGTYPGNGHWDNSTGWWYPTNDPALAIRTDNKGQGWGFSRGTKPLMPMQIATELIKREIYSVVKELGI